MNLSEEPRPGEGRLSTKPALRAHRPGRRITVAERRALLAVQCACDLLGLDPASAPPELQLPLSVSEFESALRQRFAASHPQLVYRTDSTLERARLDRSRLPHLPRVILRQGAPPRGR